MTLRDALRELKNRGETVLVAEVEALEKVLSEKPALGKPVAHRLLAHAAKLLREDRYSEAHNYLGAAIEVFVREKSGESIEVSAKVLSTLPVQGASDAAFATSGDLLEAPTDSSDFADAQSETISGFANILLNAGYIEEARKYLTAYNQEPQEKKDYQQMKISQKEALASLKAKYKKRGDLVRARALEEILADVELEESAEGAGLCKSAIMEEEAKAIVDEGKKAEAEKAYYLAKAAEEMLKDPSADQMKAAAMMKAAEDLMAKAKECAVAEEPVQEAPPVPPLHVEAPSEEELAAQTAAEEAAKEGDVKSATAHLNKAERFKATRTIAALLRKGDFNLAREGLAALANEQDAPKPEAADSTPTNSGYPVGSQETAKDEEKDQMELTNKAPQQKDEKALAESLFRRVRFLAKSGDMKAALGAATKLEKLQNEVASALKTVKRLGRTEVTASEKGSLLTEGRELLAGIHWLNLQGQKILAEALGDEDLAAEIANAMDQISEDLIEETLDSEPKIEELPEVEKEEEEEEDDENESDDDMMMDGEKLPDAEQSPAPEMAPPSDTPKPAAPELEPTAQSPEQKEDSEAMHYEVLQSFESFGPMTRDALAFTFWGDEKDPYWVIQASGKPVAEVHLADQDHADDVAAFFCDEVKWPNVVAQTVEKVGLVKMLHGVKARFYANAVTKGNLAGKMREEALAALAGERKERLAALRKDFTDALVVAAESLNKGLLANKPNPLKKAFVERLASLGIHNPALIVEEAFAEAFEPFLDQVVADANEYLEMPKEAFAMTRKMVSGATNVAQTQVSNFANETLRDRLARTSMPLAPSEPAFEAPAAEREVRAALESMSARDHNRALRGRLQLSRKY